MKMTIYVSNRNLPVDLFNQICIVLRQIAPCKPLEDGVEFADIDVGSPVYIPDGNTVRIMSVESYYKSKIRETFERVSGRSVGSGEEQIQYDLKIHYSDIAPKLLCSHMLTDQKEGYPSCQRMDCLTKSECPYAQGRTDQEAVPMKITAKRLKSLGKLEFAVLFERLFPNGLEVPAWLPKHFRAPLHLRAAKALMECGWNNNDLVCRCNECGRHFEIPKSWILDRLAKLEPLYCASYGCGGRMLPVFPYECPWRQKVVTHHNLKCGLIRSAENPVSPDILPGLEDLEPDDQANISAIIRALRARPKVRDGQAPGEEGNHEDSE